MESLKMERTSLAQFQELTLEHVGPQPVGPFRSSKEVKEYLKKNDMVSPVFS